ncbi:D-2-hydroxyacid dehydrogenase [Candidatus Bipolaricaulota bacterium]|nr:D-2-hydroxyacid dehydrogenase [Candidatus Bipolaricaulota bacterium]
MNHPLNVLVYLRESNARYRQRLTDSDDVRYMFCESEDAVRQLIEQADVILGSISFPAHLLSLASQLRWIQVTGAGVDAFLAKKALPEGVLLTRADVAFGDQIAEYVLGHLLAITQRLRDVHHLQRGHTWQPLTVEFLNGRTMGIAGTGSIGSAIANCARSMGMRVVGLASKRGRQSEFEIVYGPDDWGTFLPQLDVLVISLPLTDATRGLIGAQQLSWLKPSSILVNVARGAIVDERALVDALRHRRIRAAILDVFACEPLPADSPLWAMDHVTVTSHHAGLNIPDTIIDFFLENLTRFRFNQTLNGLVDVARGY